MRNNREYNYFGNVHEYEYDYFASYSSTSTQKVFVLEYEYTSLVLTHVTFRFFIQIFNFVFALYTRYSLSSRVCIIPLAEFVINQFLPIYNIPFLLDRNLQATKSVSKQQHKIYNCKITPPFKWETLNMAQLLSQWEMQVSPVPGCHWVTAATECWSLRNQTFKDKNLDVPCHGWMNQKG